MNIFKNSVGRPSNDLKRKRKIFYIGVVLIVTIIVVFGGFFVCTKLINGGMFQSNSYNAETNPVKVTIKPSISAVKVNKDSKVNFEILFKKNNAKDKKSYYYKWTTYKGDNKKHHEDGCSSISDGMKVKKSLTIFDKRKGTITIYSDKNCKKKIGSSVSTKEYDYLRIYTIKYNANGATSGSMNEQTKVIYGTSTNLSKNKFTKKGYKFLGWKAYNSFTNKWYCYNSKDLKTQKWLDNKDCNEYYIYSDQASVSKTAEHGETVIMYAFWIPNQEKKLDSVSLTESNKIFQDVSIDNNGSIYLSQVSNKQVETIDGQKFEYVNLLVHKYSNSSKATLYSSGYRCGHGFFSVNDGWVYTTCDFDKKDYKNDDHGMSITKVNFRNERKVLLTPFSHRSQIKVDSKSGLALARSSYDGKQHFKVFNFNRNDNTISYIHNYSFNLDVTKYDIQGYDIDDNKLYIYYGEGSTCGSSKPSKSIAYIDVYSMFSGKISLIKHNLIYLKKAYAEPEGIDIFGNKAYIGVAESSGNGCHSGNFMANVYSIDKSLLYN